MKFDAPVNPNYAAVVTSVKAVVALKGRDRIVGLPLFGYQAIAQKGWEEGDLGVFIPAESKLSLAFASENNLYRDKAKNVDPEAVGYLEDNSRVKAIKFAGHRSDAMFLPLDSLAFTGVAIEQLQDGDTFDTLNGVEILRKYERPRAAVRNTTAKATKKFNRVDAKYLPEHYDTLQYKRVADQLFNENDLVVVTQKLHGTSVRIGRTIVKHQPTLLEKIAAKLGVRIQTQGYDNVYGSKRVIKDANNPDQAHYYGTDIWTEFGKRLDGLLPDGFILFGELIGWLPDGRPIQKGYTYDLPVGTAELYVYRVSQVNPQGLQVDLTWDQMVEFCRNHGLKTVPELWRGRHGDLSVDYYLDVDYRNQLGYAQAIPLSDAKTVDEGICIRKDGLAPTILKAKSPIFFQHETKMLDAEVEDIEESGEAA